jgi:hypothetical protein
VILLISHRVETDDPVWGNPVGFSTEARKQG